MTNKTMILTRDAILATEDIKIQEVEVPEWGGTVRLRTMTGAARDIWENSAQGRVKDGKADISGMKVLVISKCAIDETGNLLFSHKDLEKLNQKSAKAINRLWDVAAKMNGIGDDSLEELGKNSGIVPSEGSGSD